MADNQLFDPKLFENSKVSADSLLNAEGIAEEMSGKDEIVLNLKTRKAEFGVHSLHKSFALEGRPEMGKTDRTKNTMYFKVRDLVNNKPMRWDHWKMASVILSEECPEDIPSYFHGATWYDAYEEMNFPLSRFWVHGFEPSQTNSGRDVLAVHCFDWKACNTSGKITEEEYKIMTKSWSTLSLPKNADMKDTRFEIVSRIREDFDYAEVLKPRYLTDGALNDLGRGWIKGQIKIVPYLTDDEKKKLAEMFR